MPELRQEVFAACQAGRQREAHHPSSTTSQVPVKVGSWGCTSLRSVVVLWSTWSTEG